MSSHMDFTSVISKTADTVVCIKVKINGKMDVSDVLNPGE